MSYARWSSDDFQSDVYVYESIGGWTTHVAAMRYVFPEPLPPVVELPPGFTDEVFESWIARKRVMDGLLDKADLVPIGLPHDGADFNDPTPGACLRRLEMLRDAGYRVPQYAIDALREEAAEL